ncbi:unnamed protein product [Didymodactylos carnosus]|uniref:H15 domain-containing protein n=1 Tax=Didymodactylos carnosus TaxID=1234261 RepID=A0A814HGL2_9BILA|nr:unnamed protein product [Didymodactylos carnosus]CAF1671428.1 unnamed protein product [Didymodactylos carnosus]CAF3780641.1 unnamed protein product [Didymodactylos carnosus]CAF4546454.1 unnamed protein product [Didymodactylos carnosus]
MTMSRVKEQKHRWGGADRVKPKRHPTYAEMVKSALVSLNNRASSSIQTIMKYILTKYLLNATPAKKYCTKALTNGVTKDVFHQTRSEDF